MPQTKSSSSQAVPHQELLAGGASGCVGILVGHPMDTLKVRMQTTMGNTKKLDHHSLMDLTTFSKGGWTSLYRGMGAPLASAALVNALIFVTYGTTGRIWDHLGTVDSSNTGTGKKSAWKPAICGFVTGIVTSTVLSPVEHIKCRVQCGQYATPRQAATDLIQTHGWQRGFFRGFTATCCRQAPSFAVWFSSYQYLQQHFLPKQLLSSTDSTSTTHSQSQTQPPQSSQQRMLWSILAGGMAGSLAWAVVYPMDVIKSRIQTLPLSTGTNNTSSCTSIRSIATQLIRQQGWTALYRGLSIAMLRAFPVNACVLPVYEYTLHWLQQHQQQHHQSTTTSGANNTHHGMLSQPIRLRRMPIADLA